MKTDFKLIKNRKAIAMIELIFSIVIMGIALMSAPMLIGTSTKSSMLGMQQESIAAAVTQMNTIMTTEWDNMDTNGTIGSPVLKTASATFAQCAAAADLTPVGVTGLSSGGRYCQGLSGPSISYDATVAVDMGTDGTVIELTSYDDVDDYHNKSYTVSVYEGDDDYDTASGDYIDTKITIASQIFYAEDAARNTDNSTGNYGQATTFSNPFRNNAPAGTTNIKIISLRLTSNNDAKELSDKQINLSAFMCNVGSPSDIITNKSIL